MVELAPVDGLFEPSEDATAGTDAWFVEPKPEMIRMFRALPTAEPPALRPSKTLFIYQKLFSEPGFGFVIL